MDRIIQAYCRSELLEDLQGDLHEFYERNIKNGKTRADLIYLLDVLKFFRLYTIKKPKILGQMTFLNLTGNYFKTSTRSLMRNRLFSVINIVGLAISMSVGVLMITYISELLSFDKFHRNSDRIYRVLTEYRSKVSDTSYDLASTSVLIGKKLKEESTGIDKVLIMKRNLKKDLKKEANVIAVEGHYVTNEFFDLFSFDLISGNAASALVEPYSIVLTERMAEKLFDDKNPVGEIVTAGDKSYTVTGVVRDVPSNSHLQFEALVSFSTVEVEERDVENSRLLSWTNVWTNYVYILVSEDQDIEVLEAQLDQISEIENAKTDRLSIDFQLENILEIVPGKELSNQLGPNMSWTIIYQLVVLTFIIIISACFNYTNLSIARSLRRAKEVGIRKVVGASRQQVFSQFIFEAVIISVLALILSYGLYLLIKPQFIHLILEDEILSMDFQFVHALYFLLFAIAIGFLAGVLPSIFLSRLKAISVLRDVTKVKLFKGLSLRRVLIVFQFAISIALITASTITYRQYKYALNFELGFTTENILNVSLQDNDSRLLMNEISKLPEVKKISRSVLMPHTGEIWMEEFKHKDPLDSVNVFLNFVDKNYVDLHEYEFLAGGTFPFDVEEGEVKFVVIDDLLRKRFNFESPQSALGEIITLERDEDVKLEIVGVVRDFQYVNIQSEKQSCAIMQGTSDQYNFLNLLITTDDAVALMKKLDAIWTEVDKVHPFEAQFYDTQIQESYNEQATTFKVFGFLAFLAISISTMGLLGMAVFTTETRIKEISIRKVMGATERGLVYVLSKGFMYMLLIATLIAVPFTYLFFELVVLVDYANRITIGVPELFSGVILIVGLGILTIGWQTTKAAKTNPAEMLRNE